MVASKTFDSILEQIQSSNLNFQLHISPFSANISLKRSPIKDKSGAPMCLPLGSQSCLPSSTDAAALASKIFNLERDLESLRKDYEFAVEDSVEAHQKIKYLESQHAVKIEPNEALKKELSEKNYLVNSLNVQISQVSKENYCCQRKVEELSLEIQDLERSKKKSDEISNKFNKELSDTRTKFKKEKDLTLKEHRTEVKAWKTDLGEERKLKIKLEEKLLKTAENSSLVLDISPRKPAPKSPIETPEETLCSICAFPIANYVPKYFLGERFNPACDNCDDNSWKSDDDISGTAQTCLKVQI